MKPEVYVFRGQLVQLIGYDGHRAMVEPIPNPERETEYVPKDIFFGSAKSPPTDWFSENTTASGLGVENQNKISFESVLNQKGIRKESEKEQKNSTAETSETTETKRNINPQSLDALPRARQMVAKDPFDVMIENWELIRWIDQHFGLETLLKRPSFPRRIQAKANAKFGIKRSGSWYFNLIQYYADYKQRIEVPIWWLRFELFLENNLFKYLID